MVIFDAPDRETCATRRPRTNTPLQALVLLNEPGFVEAARVLAERVLTEAPVTTASRLEHLFRHVLGRRPRTAELVVRDREASTVHEAGSFFPGYRTS